MVILVFRTPGPAPGLLISLIALCNSTHEHTHAYTRAHTYALLYAQTIPFNEKRPILSGIARLSRARRSMRSRDSTSSDKPRLDLALPCHRALAFKEFFIRMEKGNQYA